MPPANDHYYTAEPSSDHRPGEVRFCYGGRELVFATDSGVFSRRELDRGTEVLLAALPEPVSGPVLDMGCGYGTIGVAVGARWPGLAVTMADVNRRACDLARENARRNGVRAEVLESDGYMALGKALCHHPAKPAYPRGQGRHLPHVCRWGGKPVAGGPAVAGHPQAAGRALRDELSGHTF